MRLLLIFSTVPVTSGSVFEQLFGANQLKEKSGAFGVSDYLSFEFFAANGVGGAEVLFIVVPFPLYYLSSFTALLQDVDCALTFTERGHDSKQFNQIQTELGDSAHNIDVTNVLELIQLRPSNAKWKDRYRLRNEAFDAVLEKCRQELTLRCGLDFSKQVQLKEKLPESFLKLRCVEEYKLDPAMFGGDMMSKSLYENLRQRSLAD